MQKHTATIENDSHPSLQPLMSHEQARRIIMEDLVVVSRVWCTGAGVCVVGLATLDDDDGWFVAIAVLP